MESGSERPLADLVDAALGTQRGNLVAGGILWLASIAGFAVTRRLGATLPAGAAETLWLPLVMAVVSVPAFGGLILLVAGSGVGFPDGLRVGVIAYAAVGGLVVLFGIPGQLPSGVVPAGPFWPFFFIWLHGCVFGFGLWGCPPG